MGAGPGQLGMGTWARDLDLILHLHRGLSQKPHKQFTVLKKMCQIYKRGHNARISFTKQIK